MLMHKSNVVSMTVYGNDPKYTIGVIENALAMPDYYPEWIMRVYYRDVHESVVNILEGFGVELIALDTLPPIIGLARCVGMLYRMLINDDATVNRYIVRDADSRFTERERAAVDEWVVSGKPFHIMRDHPCHTYPIMGGMWGGTTGLFDMRSLVDVYQHVDQYLNDQAFLAQCVYPLIRDHAMIHDSNSPATPFPTERQHADDYVGRVVNITESLAQYTTRLKWLN